MTKRQTRLFFLGGTLLFALIFLGLTVDSHRQFGALTNADAITPEVEEGKHVWHRNNCINCHTLMGEGAYYAPDLTMITKQRGEAYLRAFLRDPSRFYSEEEHRRLMPNPNLSEEEITQVIAFLDWVSEIDRQGWPPRPILVSGSAIPGLAREQAPDEPATHDPIALGEHLFRSAELSCFACHSTAPGVNLAGPTLAGMKTRAAERVADPAYAGQAADAAGYIRESILQPSAYLVPGELYSSGGVSMMPSHFVDTLQPQQVDQLVAYLLTLE
jgi:nitric oxide reductase subunit C